MQFNSTKFQALLLSAHKVHGNSRQCNIIPGNTHEQRCNFSCAHCSDGNAVLLDGRSELQILQDKQQMQCFCFGEPLFLAIMVPTECKPNCKTRGNPTSLHKEDRFHKIHGLLGEAEGTRTLTLDQRREQYAVL